MTNFFEIIYDLISATVTLADFWLLFTQQLLPFVQSVHQQLAVLSIAMHLIAAGYVVKLIHRTYWLGVGDEWSSIIGLMMVAGTLLLTTGLWRLSTPGSSLDAVIFLFMALAGGGVLHISVKMQWTKWFT